MICPNCERKISEDDKFCGYCGSKIDFRKSEDNYPRILNKYKVEHTGYSRKAASIISIFRNHWKLALFIVIAFLVIWDIISSEGFGVREFPQLAEPKTVNFEWEYRGSKYSMTETFYKTVYDYYNSSPDKDCWQGEDDYELCLKSFLEEAKEDNTISRIASDIEALAFKNSLSGDELLEFTVAFVQSIPYDEDKLELVLYSKNPEDLYPRYPYEVLYDNEGVCTGKSFLATSLIEKLGYGVAFFDYEALTEDGIGHIAPAVKCPKEYSSYDSGYCYTETTGTGFKIGEIPEMDIDTKIPRIRTPLKLFEEESVFGISELELGKAEIHVIVDGNSYQGIINTAQTIQTIETLEKEIDRLDLVIRSLDKEIKQLENSVIYYEQQSEAAYKKYLIFQSYSSYNEYSNLYSQYEYLYAKYKSKLNEYNKKVDQYNGLVDEYNIVLDDFYK